MNLLLHEEIRSPLGARRSLDDKESGSEGDDVFLFLLIFLVFYLNYYLIFVISYKTLTIRVY